MKIRSIRRSEYLILLVIVVSVSLGALTTYLIFHAKKTQHVASTVSQAETLLELTNSFVSTYSQQIQNINTENTQVPAEFRASAANHFNEGDEREDRPMAMMVGLPEREIKTPPIDQNLAQRLSLMVESGRYERYSTEYTHGDDTVLRTVFPSIASEESCVACHNKMQPDGPAWQKNDLMGAYVVDQSIQMELQRSWFFSLFGGVLATMVSLLGGGLIAYSRKLHAQSISLKVLADTDPLTGCLNRRALTDAYEQAKVLQNGGALYLLDLDHFKRINDLHGHDAGDRVLTHFAELLKGQLRRHDLIARIGGEEFVVLLPGAEKEQVSEIANRICRAVSESTIEHEEQTVSYTVSIGTVVIHTKNTHPLQTWLSAADKFLYQAKLLGRNQIFPRSS